jgi:hypothetical protein
MQTAIQPTRRALVAALLATAVLPLPVSAVVIPATDLVTLTAVARALFPHDAVPDATYAAIVSRTVAGAADATSLTMAASVLAGPPTTIAARIAASFALPGVQMLRIATLIGLYGDLAVVRSFGYPGPSINIGGYRDHGFGDLKWLPEPGRAFVP